MGVKLPNLVRGTLAASLTALSTDVQLAAGQGIRFPILGADDWYPLAIENESGQVEYCRGIARTGDTISVLRGQEGTQPRAFAVGAVVEIRMTNAALLALKAEA